MMARFVEWLRSLRLWFVRQRNLRAQVVAAEHRFAALEVEHWFAMQELVEGHRVELAKVRHKLAEAGHELDVMRAECERWKAMYEEVNRASAAVRD